MRNLVIPAVMLYLLSSPALADWPQFGGPDRNFCSQESGLIDAFGQDGAKVLWSADANPGYSGAAIADGKVFFLDRVNDKQDVLKVFDLKKGDLLWSVYVDATGSTGRFPGQRSTPSVTDDAVYAVGALGDVYCFDRKTKKLRWSKDLIEEYDGELPKWVSSQSPLVLEDKVIVAPLSGKAGLVALDKSSGKALWQSPPIGGMEYTSPDLMTVGGQEQLVMFTGKGVVGLDPEDGSILWGYTGWKGRVASVPQPVKIDENRLFMTSGYNVGSAIIEVQPTGDTFRVNEQGKTKEISCQVQTPIKVGDYLYGLDNGNGRNEGMVCADTDGKVIWKSGRKPGFERGQMIYADGKLFVLHGQTGDLYIVQPSPEGYKELSKTSLLSGRKIWAPLALTDGLLVVRDQSSIKCVDIRK
jgi:outer membrane protein assembly factor BamB